MVIVVVMDWIDCLKLGESNKYWRKIKFQQVCDPESFMLTEEGGIMLFSFAQAEKWDCYRGEDKYLI